MSAAHADDEDDLHVSIEGSEEAINKAEQQVQQILFNPEQAMKLKGAQLQSLAELNGSTTSTSSVYGPGGGGGGSDEYQIELRIPNNMVGLIIGKGGENIHRMQTQSGANMQIAKESEMKPGDTLRSIWLKGDPDKVADLKLKIEETITSRMAAATTPRAPTAGPSSSRELDNAFVYKVAVPNDKVGIIIGKGGMTIKSIQERTGATVQVSSYHIAYYHAVYIIYSTIHVPDPDWA